MAATVGRHVGQTAANVGQDWTDVQRAERLAKHGITPFDCAQGERFWDGSATRTIPSSPAARVQPMQQGTP